MYLGPVGNKKTISSDPIGLKVATAICSGIGSVASSIWSFFSGKFPSLKGRGVPIVEKNTKDEKTKTVFDKIQSFVENSNVINAIRDTPMKLNSLFDPLRSSIENSQRDRKIKNLWGQVEYSEYY